MGSFPECESWNLELGQTNQFSEMCIEKENLTTIPCLHTSLVYAGQPEYTHVVSEMMKVKEIILTDPLAEMF